jgi:anti-sigma factor RsiW
MGNLRCKWVHDNLPLLAGGELVGPDRRKVERHLIGCPECRQHQAALADAVSVLHAVAAHPPVRPDAPSLWPALARQMRESRRPAPVPVLAFAWPRGGRWSPVVGLGALGLLAAIGVAVELNRPDPPATAEAVAQSRPASAPDIGRAVTAARPEQALDLRAEGPDPAPSRDLVQVSQDTPVFEGAPSRRLDYDLDRGTPMPFDTRDARQPTY